MDEEGGEGRGYSLKGDRDLSRADAEPREPQPQPQGRRTPPGSGPPGWSLPTFWRSLIRAR